jgi:DnaK suppressor protein
MEPATLETIKKILLDRQAKVTAQLAEVSNGAGQPGAGEAAFPDYGSDDDENTAEVETFTTNLSLEKVLGNSLRDIESALERIEKGTYGVCKYCGNKIDERRLLARPASSACVTCKETIKNRV